MSRVPVVVPPRARRTRLVATIGPASAGLLEPLVAIGLDVARINLSHGSHAEHRAAAAAVRAAASAAGRAVAILVDLPGPKLRLGALPDDELELASGARVRIGGAESDAAASADRPGLAVSDPSVPGRLRVGDRLLLADGAAELRVVSVRGGAVEADVVRGGTVRSRQGVSVPAERIDADALDEADEPHIDHLLGLEPDLVGQSFVRSAADVLALRSRLPDGARIVAKIETRPAVEHVTEILDVADAIMVARGDLGVELPFEQVPLIQKDLVSAALAAGKPSIVATQMLESMVDAPRPTRAEAGDITNAILDGADAVMLSAETAVGRYPLEALQAAADIAAATDAHERPRRPPSGVLTSGSERDAQALAVAAVAMADADADIVGLACYTHSGQTARRLAALRPDVRISAFTPDDPTARGLALARGVDAFVARPAADDPESVTSAVVAGLRASADRGFAGEDDAIVLVQTGATDAPGALHLLRPYQH